MRTRRSIHKYQQRKKSMKRMATFNTGLALLSAACIAPAHYQQAGHVLTVHAQNLSPAQFLNLVADSAKRIAANNDLYASVMIAQAALESAWGNSTLAKAPNHNLFGIKGKYEGQSVEMPTLEDNGEGEYYQINDHFRKYDEYAESLEDYARLLTGGHDSSDWRYNFYAGARRSNTQSYHDATKHLTGRYATDTRYGPKLDSIIKMYNLTRYDVVDTTAIAERQIKAEEEQKRLAEQQRQLELRQAQNQTSSNSTGVTYVVQPGDGLYRIASAHGMTLNQLLAQTGFNINTVIHPGQVLNLGTAAKPVQPAAPSESKPATESNENKVNTEKINQTPAPSASAPQATPKPIVPATPAPAAPRPSQGVSTPRVTQGTYVVQRGQGLYTIARQNGMTLNELMQMNGLTSYLIHPGQVLKVKGQTPTVSSASSKETAPTTQETVTENKVTPSVPETSNTATAPNYTQPVVESTLVVEEAESKAPAAPAESTPSTTQSHVVQAGDTLYGISMRYGVDVHQLIANNQGSSLIHVGQVINF